MKLEERLIINSLNDSEFDLEEGLLIASGLDSEEKIGEYKGKLDLIHERGKSFIDMHQRQVPEDYVSLERAKLLFQYLYVGKPSRYNGNFLFTDVLDAQLSDGDCAVGNCTGLTSLYTVLALREGLDVGIKLMPGHVKNLLFLNGLEIEVENTNPDGFGKIGLDYEKLKNPNYLIHLIYDSRKDLLKNVTSLLFESEHNADDERFALDILLHKGYYLAVSSLGEKVSDDLKKHRSFTETMALANAGQGKVVEAFNFYKEFDERVDEGNICNNYGRTSWWPRTCREIDGLGDYQNGYDEIKLFTDSTDYKVAKSLVEAGEIGMAEDVILRACRREILSEHDITSEQLADDVKKYFSFEGFRQKLDTYRIDVDRERNAREAELKQILSGSR